MLDEQQPKAEKAIPEEESANGRPAEAPEPDRAEEPAVAETAGELPAEEPSELEKALAERDKAVAEKDELLDRYQRAQADFQNVRKRLQREQDQIREYAAMDTIQALLPVVDDLERALEAAEIDPDFKKGLELIRDRLAEVFQRAGLQPVEHQGRFDPNLHEAVDRGTAEQPEDDQKILEVYRKGYRFKDRLLRPAMVKVAVKE